MKEVKCPCNLASVQLQGLDLPIIFQTLQWLVKKLLETRDERNAVSRTNARSYFKTRFTQAKSQTKAEESKFSDNKNIYLSESKYNYIATGRQFRPTNKSSFEYNDPLRVYFTLIEHGMNKDLSFQRALVDLLKKKNLISDKEARRETVTSIAQSAVIKDSGNKDSQQLQAITTEEKKKLDELLSSNIVQVTSETNKFHRVSTSVIEEIFSENIESIINEIDKYENLKEDENIDRIKLFLKEKERLENNKINLISQVQDYESELESVFDKIRTGQEEITAQNEQIRKLDKNLEDNKSNLEKLNQKIKTAKISEEKMRLIGEKIRHKEDLKLAITKFKKDCLEEKKSYDVQLENLERKIEKMNDSENTQVFDEIDRNYQQEYEKMVVKKKDLFEQNKIINLLTRKIQVFPSKLELIQYQKRFQELYDQINNVSEKSRKILNEINSSDEVIKLLTQKLEMFVQLREAYKSSKSKKDKENFKESLNNVLESLGESLKRNAERIKTLSKNIEENQGKLNELQMYENKYMKLIKEYNKEYNKFNRSYGS